MTEIEKKEDNPELVELYKSYSRVNTDFLKESLGSAGIMFKCILKGGLLGRGSQLGVGIFQPSNEDAVFYVAPEDYEKAEEVRNRVIGDQNGGSNA